MADFILEMEHISKAFPGVQALDEVHFKLERGSIHALMGENGAGKSTFIKIITGVYQPDSGIIKIDGTPVQIHSPWILSVLALRQFISMSPAFPTFRSRKIFLSVMKQSIR